MQKRAARKRARQGGVKTNTDIPRGPQTQPAPAAFGGGPPGQGAPLFLRLYGGRGSCMRKIEAERVLDELAEIAFAQPGEEGGPPVKVADKLRALELLYKHLGLGESAGVPAVTVIDDLAPQGEEVVP